MRQKAFQNEIGCVSTSRDYAERLPFKFNLEIQSEHFGKGRSLSIEGSTVETHTAQAIQAGVVDNELSECQKERVSKLLLQISIRELHNDMLLPPDEGGFKEARDETGNVRISDTALRALLPEQARKMTPRHKQMCGCEVCIQIRHHQNDRSSLIGT